MDKKEKDSVQNVERKKKKLVFIQVENEEEKQSEIFDVDSKML